MEGGHLNQFTPTFIAARYGSRIKSTLLIQLSVIKYFFALALRREAQNLLTFYRLSFFCRACLDYTGCFFTLD